MNDRLLIVALIGGMAAPRVHADEHLVAPPQLQDTLNDAGARRESDLARLDGLLSTEEARRAGKMVRADVAPVRAALPSLTDRELRDLT